MTKQPGTFWSRPPGWAAMGLIGAVSYFLLVEHRQHLFEFLPFLILLACPLMHVFMHRGHGHHHSAGSEHNSVKDSFKQTTDTREAYGDDRTQGLKTDGEAEKNKENHHAS